MSLFTRMIPALAALFAGSAFHESTSIKHVAYPKMDYPKMPIRWPQQVINGPANQSIPAPPSRPNQRQRRKAARQLNHFPKR